MITETTSITVTIAFYTMLAEWAIACFWLYRRDPKQDQSNKERRDAILQRLWKETDSKTL